MSKVAIKGNASGTGTFTLEAPNSNTDRTLNLPDEAGTVITSASDIESQVKTATNATGSAPIYACRAWVNFDGATNTGGNCDIRASGNVSTVADNGVGQYEVNFATAMPDANYTIVTNGGAPNVSSGTVTKGASLAINGDAASPFLEVPSTTSFHVLSTDDTSNYADNVDCAWVNVAVFR